MGRRLLGGEFEREVGKAEGPRLLPGSDTAPVYTLMCVLKEQASIAVNSVQTSELLPRKILAETLALTKPLLLQSSLQKLGA